MKRELWMLTGPAVIPSWLVVFVVAGALSGCSGIRSLNTGGVPTLTVADINAGGEGGPFSRLARGEAAIVHFAPGDTLPLDLEANLPFASLEGGQNAIRFQRDVYLYIGRNTFAISPDQRRWADVRDLHAVREVFGAGAGTFQFGFGARRGQPAGFRLVAGWH